MMTRTHESTEVLAKKKLSVRTRAGLAIAGITAVGALAGCAPSTAEAKSNVTVSEQGENSGNNVVPAILEGEGATSEISSLKDIPQFELKARADSTPQELGKSFLDATNKLLNFAANTENIDKYSDYKKGDPEGYGAAAVLSDAVVPAYLKGITGAAVGSGAEGNSTDAWAAYSSELTGTTFARSYLANKNNLKPYHLKLELDHSMLNSSKEDGSIVEGSSYDTLRLVTLYTHLDDGDYLKSDLEQAGSDTEELETYQAIHIVFQEQDGVMKAVGVKTESYTKG